MALLASIGLQVAFYVLSFLCSFVLRALRVDRFFPQMYHRRQYQARQEYAGRVVKDRWRLDRCAQPTAVRGRS